MGGVIIRLKCCIVRLVNKYEISSFYTDFMWLYSLVYVGPGQKSRLFFYAKCYILFPGSSGVR